MVPHPMNPSVRRVGSLWVVGSAEDFVVPSVGAFVEAALAMAWDGAAGVIGYRALWHNDGLGMGHL